MYEIFYPKECFNPKLYGVPKSTKMEFLYAQFRLLIVLQLPVWENGYLQFLVLLSQTKLLTLIKERHNFGEF